MKKRFLAIATALACAFGFSACEGDDWKDLIEQTDLAGHVTLYVSNAQEGQMYQDGDSIRFKSAVSNVRFDTVIIDSLHRGYNITAGTLLVGTRDNAITHADEELQPPFLGINLRDTNTGVHRINCPIDKIDFFRYLYETNVESIILSGVNLGTMVGNLFAVAYDSTSYYIGYSGSINITEFGAQNSLVVGTVNVNCIYITNTQLEELVNDEQYYDMDLSDHFPTVTFTGEISSRRADIAAVVNALENDAHLQEE